MTPQQSLELLKQHNAWRRNTLIQNGIEMPDPIGDAIDVAIRVLEALEMETINNI